MRASSAFLRAEQEQNFCMETLEVSRKHGKLIIGKPDSKPASESLTDYVSKYFFFQFVELYIKGHLTVADVQEGAESLFTKVSKQTIEEMGTDVESKKVIMLSTSSFTPRELGRYLYETYLRSK
jgi:hypothetical protein